MSDESYSLLCSYKDKEGVDEKWAHIFSSTIIWFYWILFSSMGGIIGKLITFNTTGIDFALTALFVVILIEQIKNSQIKIPSIVAIISSIIWIILIGTNDFFLPSLLTTVFVLLIMQKTIHKDSNKEV